MLRPNVSPIRKNIVMLPGGVVRLAAVVGLSCLVIENNECIAASGVLGLATVEVLVTAAGICIQGATVALDLDLSGAWDEDLEEPIGETDEHGVAVFTSVTRIEPRNSILDGTAEDPAWAPHRLEAGLLRGNPAAECLTIAYTAPTPTSHFQL